MFVYVDHVDCNKPMRRKTIAQLVDVDAANMLCPLSVFLKKKILCTVNDTIFAHL